MTNPVEFSVDQLNGIGGGEFTIIAGSLTPERDQRWWRRLWLWFRPALELYGLDPYPGAAIFWLPTLPMSWMPMPGYDGYERISVSWIKVK